MEPAQKPKGIGSLDNVHGATEADLIFTMITPDGRGSIIKKAALDELLERAKQSGYEEGRFHGETDPENW